jgi:hypothetical protein
MKLRMADGLGQSNCRIEGTKGLMVGDKLSRDWLERKPLYLSGRVYKCERSFLWALGSLSRGSLSIGCVPLFGMTGVVKTYAEAVKLAGFVDFIPNCDEAQDKRQASSSLERRWRRALTSTWNEHQYSHNDHPITS